ncbi:MAG: DinB family protein [Planctomycetota bacterium]|nr:DinB family protein [Planctomycetota bacterium]
MNTVELAADVLQRNVMFLTSTVADFSDSDFLVRPCPGANHATWQLGHLICSETRMINGVAPGAGYKLPDGFEQKFKKETASIDDPAFFPRKDEIVDLFTKARGATIAWIRTLSEADLAKNAPEGLQRMAPTVGHMLWLTNSHLLMHVGQFQVIRRKLGKPVLF